MFKKKYMLISGGTLVFLCFVIGVLSVTLNYVKLNQEWALRELKEQVKAGSEQLQFYFKSLRSDLIKIERYMANNNMKVDEELYGYLNFVRSDRPNAIPAILILDANGNVVASTNPSLVQSSFRESEYFKNIRHSTNKVYLSEAIAVSDLPGRSGAASTIIKDPLDLGFVFYTGIYSKGVFKGAVLFVLRGEPFFNRYSMSITKLTSGAGFILQEDGRILFQRDVELRGGFLSDLPESSELSKVNGLLEKSEEELPVYDTIGQQMMVASKIRLDNQRWTIGILTSTSKLAQKTMTLIYTLSGLVVFLGVIVFGLVFVLIRLDQARDALRGSEEKYRRLVETITDLVFTLDQNGRFTYINPKVERITGHPVQDLIGHSFTEILAPEHIESTVDRFRRGLSGEKISIYEVDLIHKDGKKIPVELNVTSLLDADNKPIGRTGVARDITERKQTEESLRKSEAKSQLILQTIPSGLFTVDTDRKITYWNKEAEKITGLKTKEVIGKNCIEALDCDDCKGCGLFDKKADEPLYEKECLLHVEGKKIIISKNTDSLKDENGQLVGGLVSFVDITKSKRLEAQLLQSQKMESIGTLAGGIAHDFNNILLPIIGYTEMAMAEMPENSTARIELEEVIKSSNRAKELVLQILTFSRNHSKEQKPLEIQSVIKEALKFLRVSIPTTIEISQSIDNECGAVMGNPTQIHQILMNLCTNAYHAMEDKGGVLLVSLANVHLDAESIASYPGLNSGDYVKLTISDTGHGMEKAVKDRIFEPYFTTKEVDRGTGMGLSVVHGIVTSHNGYITAYSEPDKGTTFNVYLPRIDMRGMETEADPFESIQMGDEHILLVDDEEKNVHMLRQMLEFLGYKVTGQHSSLDALEAFRSQPDKFDLVLTDMTMPNMTGDILAKELMGIKPDIPIILLSGFSQKMSEEKARAIGIREYIMKPVVMSDFAKTIRKVLDKE